MSPDDRHTPDTADAGRALFQLVIQPRWRDLDAFNHVNNSNFMTYLEEARVRWFETLGQAWVSDTIAPLLAAVQINFKRPIEYPSTIRVALFTQRVGTSSVTLGHRISSEDGSLLYADGHSVLVWVDRHSGRPIALPESVRAVAEGAIALS